MALADWDKNSAGNVALTPIASLEAASIFGGVVGLRLELSQFEDRPHTDLRAVQTSMSPDQARDLILLLQWCLDHLDAPPDQTH